MGNQNNGSGQQYISSSHIVNYQTLTKAVTADDIDRSCLRALRCPDTIVVKNQLKESKDKLLHKSIEWILQDPQYISWRDGDDVCLLWIRGGAGKGKTMMSIGLIERLSSLHDSCSTVVTYFFCRNADYKLNTLEANIKGLILQLVNQQKELRESLRSRWDTTTERFVEDMSSWRTLWNIFFEMLYRCKCSRVYVIVDALDECQDDIAGFLKLLVRTGLDCPSKIKWLLTSRPLDSAEQELLTGLDQVLVSLELNSKNISEAVKAYISFKVDELDRRCRYGEILLRKIEAELTKRAGDTYIWVSLVCRTLESVHRDKALNAIQDLPPGLHPLYNRVLNQLRLGESAVIRGCIRFIKVMLLAYRPLKAAEVGSILGPSNDGVTIQALVDRCASFFKMQGTEIEFVHQSARDYLAGTSGQCILDSYEHYGHAEIALNCLSYLTDRLKVNLADLPQPGLTRGSMKANLLVNVAYAATFWMQHFEEAKQTTLIQDAITEQGELGKFLRTKLLEWLECLSLLDKLPCAIGALRILVDAIDTKKELLLSTLVHDATRFLLRHYQTLATWPLQVYSSALVLSPQTSVVRRYNLGKVPPWLSKLPQMEDAWSSLIQTFARHSGRVYAVAFSPDGKQIVSGSYDSTIKLWSTTTGNLLKTFEECAKVVAFSPDGKHIVSGSYDRTIKLLDTTTNDVHKTLKGHSDTVNSVAFSPDGKQIVSGSYDRTIKLWDTTTGDVQKMIKGHSKTVSAVVFSPDGEQIVSGSYYNTIKLWDPTTGSLQKMLKGHLDGVSSVAFSPGGEQIVSGSWDGTIKLWDTTTGNLLRTLATPSSSVDDVVFSRDGKQLASGSSDKTVKLWDITIDGLQKPLVGHSKTVRAITYSPNGKQIASGSHDETIKLWDTTTGNLLKTLGGHRSRATAEYFGAYNKDLSITIVFSPDGKQIVSGSWDRTTKLWETTTGRLLKTLEEGKVKAVAFSSDGKQIALGLGLEDMIKLRNVDESSSSHLEFRAQQEINTSGRINFLKFSADGRHLVTNLGQIKIECTFANRQSLELEPLDSLRVDNQWI